MPEGTFRKFCRQHADGFVGEGDDDKLDADPGDEEKGSDLELWPFVEELDKDGGGKTHEHDAAKAAAEHEDKSPASIPPMWPQPVGGREMAMATAARMESTAKAMSVNSTLQR